eukprot:gene26436-33014_t
MWTDDGLPLVDIPPFVGPLKSILKKRPPVPLRDMIDMSSRAVSKKESETTILTASPCVPVVSIRACSSLFRASSLAGAGFIGEMLEQHQRVLTAFAQGGNAQWRDVQAIVQVGTESALIGGLAQVERLGGNQLIPLDIRIIA